MSGRCEPQIGAGLAAVGLLVLALFLAALPVAAEPVFPTLGARVVDEAGLLGSAERSRLDADLAALEARTGAQLVVVTLRSLQGYEIEEFGYKLGRHWGIGQKGKDNGALLIVAPNERSVRVEVGRGLEPTLTDALSKAVIERVILPRFRRGDFPGGILAGAAELGRVIAQDPAGEAQPVVAPEESGDRAALVFFVIWMLVVLYLIWRAHRAASEERRLGVKGRRRRSGTGGDMVQPGGWGGSGGWSGVSSSSGGGGFSGGGGSFGGGGASGRW